ncbi:ornithine carbamoyltransferase [Actinomadura madurae]|uniref:ornithine carbamoyltransferase n=1 Tax=Actinomadura madurae TaxID=1993 RepID=UPI0020D24261|nr:ornithine carbamoyltransferase [Actinomadura madurae]MCP9948966.1 ornithine carbamoyltransferase [Actinomadura madurae]MCP9965739.1 ornithine carbamoyltransferase [Actinomadura madurae]MCP9978215.1 ornithine carbamoyltransferase [Actinomadura madurae]MCQ0010272.1 ornithine carbamoyltransferase [Actinomadura madurae]MCQ0014418.1 ornithine carbamoyltransferase [Actinomadura madurae]
MKDLLRIDHLTGDDLALLLELAAGFQDGPGSAGTLLSQRIVPMYFAKPSTRTRLSTAAAVARLGGTPVSVGPDELQLRRGETIADTARVIGSYSAAIVIRTFSDTDVEELASAAPIPVVNALTDGHHPLQAVADLLTVQEHFGRLRGHRIAYIGDGGNVARSLMEAAALAGMDISVASPPGYEPSDEAVTFTATEADRNGGGFVLTTDPAEAVKDASVVYTDVWLSMGDPEEQKARRRKALTPYRVDEHLMACARDDAVFMHCLPAHRGQEVTAGVIDGGRSLAFRQASNRLPATQAVLYALLTDRLKGQR